MGYYKQINGKNYDGQIIELAEISVSGKGDGRISLDDAKAILNAVQDANSYTEIEKETISYIRDNFKFTKEADAWFRKQIRVWAAKRGAAKGKKKSTGKKKASSKKKKTTAKKKTASKKKPSSKKKTASKKKSKKN